MISGSTSAFIFIQIAAGPAGLGVRDLLGDVLEDALAQVDRRHRHLLELGRLGIAGDEIEDARDVARDHRIGGEERQVGVDARRHRMIVAGADVHVGRQRAALAAHHQRQLGVGLELDEAVDHLHAGALQVARPADVGLLVEARLELDQRGDRLAGFGGLGQRADDRRVLGGAVERLLDRDDVRIARRLMQELHHDVERLVGMVDDQVLLPDRGEAVAAVIADALRESADCTARIRDRAGRWRASCDSSLSASMPSTRNTSSSATPSARCTKRRSSAGIAASISSRITEPRRRRLSARLEQPHQILGLFLDFDVGVADDAERALPLHRVAGEQLAG